MKKKHTECVLLAKESVWGLTFHEVRATMNKLDGACIFGKQSRMKIRIKKLVR